MLLLNSPTMGVGRAVDGFRRRMKPILAAFCFLVAAFAPSAYVAWQARDLANLGQAYDDAVYWASAQSIGLGHGYHLSYQPGNPAQTLFPPAYPLLLSIAWKIRDRFPENAPLAL